jgi:hypothetical protein
MSDTKGHPDDRRHEPDVEHENPRVAHEPTDVNVKGITKWGIGLGIFTIASVFVVWFVFDQLVGYVARQSPEPSPLADVRGEREPPEPRLQPIPRLDVAETQESDGQVLNTFGWTDEERGIARIPVDSAMNLMLRKGFPVRTQQADAATASQRTLPADSSSGRTYERRAQ